MTLPGLERLAIAPVPVLAGRARTRLDAVLAAGMARMSLEVVPTDVGKRGRDEGIIDRALVGAPSSDNPKTDIPERLMDDLLLSMSKEDIADALAELDADTQGSVTNDPGPEGNPEGSSTTEQDSRPFDVRAESEGGGASNEEAGEEEYANTLVESFLAKVLNQDFVAVRWQPGAPPRTKASKWVPDSLSPNQPILRPDQKRDSGNMSLNEAENLYLLWYIMNPDVYHFSREHVAKELQFKDKKTLEEKHKALKHRLKLWGVVVPKHFRPQKWFTTFGDLPPSPPTLLPEDSSAGKTPRNFTPKERAYLYWFFRNPQLLTDPSTERMVASKLHIEPTHLRERLKSLRHVVKKYETETVNDTV